MNYLLRIIRTEIYETKLVIELLIEATVGIVSKTIS